MEDVVATVISSVYDKFKVVPNHLLAFLDKKVMHFWLDIAYLRLVA